MATYKQVAEKAGSPKVHRTVVNVLSKNKDLKISCHRAVKYNRLVGGYFGSKKLNWKELALLLKEGVVAVMPTDTIYGICGSALNKKTVKRIYKLKKRNHKKPFIILISLFSDLKKFGIVIDKQQRKILNKVWPGKTSVILDNLAFRLPKKKELLKILKISGPLVASSANLGGEPPARTIIEAKKYFGNKVVYYDGGKITGKPSKLIRLLKGGGINIIRK